MKKSIFATVAVLAIGSAIAVSPMAWSQDQGKAVAAKDASHGATSRPLTVAGQVSADGKSLMTDIDSEWAVSNAEALKGLEGRRVAVKCYVDSERNRIHVLSARALESQYTAHRGDSAFRR